MKSEMKKSIPFFKIFTISMLLFIVFLIVLLFAADITYVDGASMMEVLTSAAVRQAFFLSMYTSLTATLLSILIAVPAAYALSRYSFRGMIVLDTIIDLLIVIPVVVVGISILVFFRVGGDLAASQVLPIRWLGNLVESGGELFVYSKPGIILAQFFCVVSYAIRTIKSTFDDIDPRTEQVAMTLGCTRSGAFGRITLPLAKHGIVAGAVLSWVRAFGIFGAIIIVGGSVRGRTEVLPTAIYLELSIGRLEQSLAISLLMVATAVIVLVTLRLVSGRSLFGGSSSS